MTATPTSPLQSEKAFRAFLREKGLLLKTLMLPDALPLAAEFRQLTRGDSGVLPQQGDGLVFTARYAEGFEIVIDRLFRLASDDVEAHRRPAMRLRLRLQYAGDKTVFDFLAAPRKPGDVNGFATWADDDGTGFVRQVQGCDAYRHFAQVAPRFARITLDERSYRAHDAMPDPAAGPWWGVDDVR